MSLAVPYTSAIRRKGWMMEGLLQDAYKSFWSPMTGNSKESVVYQSNNGMAGKGHTVTFQFRGNLSGKAIKGKEQAYGKGEQNRIYSDTITVDRYRLAVDNGDEYDGISIDELNLTNMMSTRGALTDRFYRFMDQCKFDSAQGNIGQSPSHIINIDTTSSSVDFDSNTLNDLEYHIKTASGFSTGGIRAPLDAYKTSDGMPYWLFVVDASVARQIKNSAKYQSLVYNADVRGNGNRAIKGIIGKVGQLLIVEANNFFGYTTASGSSWNFDDTSTEIPGLRRRDSNSVWTGQPGYVDTGTQTSRALLLGATALQCGYGLQPDFKFQESPDFGITSESALVVYTNTQKTNLTIETGEEYKQAKVSNLDYGIIAVDVAIA